MSRTLDAYHRLPYPGRVAVGAARGAWLSWWRYGRDAERHRLDVAARDRWSSDQLESWQADRLASVLRAAARDVPHHQRAWAGAGGDPTDLSAWPVLTKQALRDAPDALLVAGADLRRLFRSRSSGTTGTPVTVWSSRAEVQQWYAVHEQRVRRWHGVDRHQRWAILGGQLVVPPGQVDPPWWLWNPVLHQLYLSSAHVGVRHAPAVAAALRRFAPTHVLAYPSALAHLADACMAAGLTLPRLVVAIANAEEMTATQRTSIGTAFGAPVRDTYGQSEMLVGASECENGVRHLWSDVGLIEVLDDDDCPVPAGTTGRLVVTSLLHRTMPLIRCDTGDRGRAPTPSSCGCGRALPVLDVIEGRSTDAIITPDGRRVFWINPVFADLPIREAQVEQQSPSALLVRVVAVDGLDDATRRTMVARLVERVGTMTIVVEDVAAIERGPNGKFRPVISSLDG